MGKDYYHDLGLTRSATEICIKKAYRKLSLKYHPDKDETAHAATVFAAVAEAYDVLSDPKNKGFYDLYGEEGLKEGVSDGKGGKNHRGPERALRVRLSQRFHAVVPPEVPLAGRQSTRTHGSPAA